MSEAAALQSQTTKPQSSGASGLLLQRKCACGGSFSFSGECEECKRKRLLGKPLQRKLAINKPGDEYEREADRVADKVMRMPEAPVDRDTTSPPAAPLVQRRVSSPSTAGIGSTPPIVQEVLSSPGQPLDAAARAFFEPLFEHDFSNVRIHTDAKAAQSARSVTAQAYTVGNHVVFGSHATPTSNGNSLLAHELTHVVQQNGCDAHFGELQRAPIGGSEVSSGNVTDEAFLSEVLDFLDSFRDIRAQITDLGINSFTVYRLRTALNQFDEQWRSMDYHDKFGPSEFYGLLEYAGQVLRLYEEVIPGASMQVRTESDVTTLANVRNRLASLNSQLARLQGRSFIKSKAEQVKEYRAAQSQAALKAQASESARRETPEGRREDAVAFTSAFVTNEHKWWSGQALSTAEVFAEQLGSYYLHEKQLSGANIQMVLVTLGKEDPVILDRALYQGELLGYLLDQGVTGLSFAALPHATGSGFYNGFEFTWRDLIAAQPITIPSFSPPTAFDVMKYELGMQWGVLVGIKDGAISTVQDVLSLFQVETYTQLYAMLTSQIWDETWREEMGKSFAIALHAYLQDVRNDGPFEIGKKFGGFIGQAVFEIILGILTAGVVKVVTKALRGTKWGAALLNLADDVAHAMPWREGGVVEGEVVPDRSPRSVETPPVKTEFTPSAPRKSAGEGTVSPTEELPQVSAGSETDVPIRGELEVRTALAGPPTKAGSEPPPNLPTLSSTEGALLKRTGDPKQYPGELPKAVADQELAIVRRAEKKVITATGDGFVYEVDLGNGHKWKGKQDGTWCRFSPTPPANCTKPGAVNKRSGGESTDPTLEAAGVEGEWPKEVQQLIEQGVRIEPEEFQQFRDLVAQDIPEMEAVVKSVQAANDSAKQAYRRALSEINPRIEELDVHIGSILGYRKEFPEHNERTQSLLNQLKEERAGLRREIAEKKSQSEAQSAILDKLRLQALDLYKKRFTLQQTNYLKSLNSINKERTKLLSKVTENQSEIDEIRRRVLENEELFEKDLNSKMSLEEAKANLERRNAEIPGDRGALKAENRNIERNLIPGLERLELALRDDFVETRTIMEAEELAGRFDKEIYLRLRRRTPTDDIRNRVINKANNKDAIYDTDIEGTPEADHIVPMFHIVKMRGFRDLEEDYRVKVLNYRQNFWALDKRVNASKGGKLFGEWKGHPDFADISAAKRTELEGVESKLIGELEELIEQYLAEQASSSAARRGGAR